MTPIRAAAEIAAREAEKAEKSIDDSMDLWGETFYRGSSQAARAIERAILKLEDGMTKDCKHEHRTSDGTFEQCDDCGVMLERVQTPDTPTQSEVRFSEKEVKAAYDKIFASYSLPLSVVSAIASYLAADATTQLRAAEKATYERGLAEGRSCERQDREERAEKAATVEWPVFTGRDLRREFERPGERGGLNAWDYLARYINNSLCDLVTFRPTPSESLLKPTHPIPSRVYELAGNAWVQACNQPGGHYFEPVVRPIFEAFFEVRMGK